jgi:hypothetical protein
MTESQRVGEDIHVSMRLTGENGINGFRFEDRIGP